MYLSPEMKFEMERRARQAKDVHERLRLCVILARSEGMSHESIAQAHRITAFNWTDYILRPVETWNFDRVGLALLLNLPASHNLFKLCCFA